MKLELKREVFTEQTTIGRLFIDGQFECFICEDRYRPPTEQKVPGKTCIPNGTYSVVINHSPRFGVPMPLLEHVPGFTGIRVHPGNGADDTEGCLLPGQIAEPNRVLRSRVAYDALFKKLKAAKGPIEITVSGTPR